MFFSSSTVAVGGMFTRNHSPANGAITTWMGGATGCAPLLTFDRQTWKRIVKARNVLANRVAMVFDKSMVIILE